MSEPIPDRERFSSNHLVPARRRVPVNPRAIIAGTLSVAIIGLAIWYLARPEPLLVQGEARSTRIDMAAPVPGRPAKIAVVRGQDVAAGATLLVIDTHWGGPVTVRARQPSPAAIQPRA